MAGVTQMAATGDDQVSVRLSESGERRYAWAVNHSGETRVIQIKLKQPKALGEILRGTDVVVSGDGFKLTIPQKVRL
jgi:hypothetical protein